MKINSEGVGINPLNLEGLEFTATSKKLKYATT